MNRLSICIAACTAILCLTAKVAIDESHLARTRTPPPLTEQMALYEVTSLRRFSLGFNNALASLIWIKLLQDAQHTKMTEGEVSWEYAQIASLLELDRSFLRAYEFGASYLSIFRQDKIGAKAVLTGWTRQQPNYWRAHYTLGYHLFAEMHDFENASKCMLKASTLENTPSWVAALGIRLLSKAGMTLSALEMSIKLFSSARDAEGAYRIGRRIRTLWFQIELSRWNEALQKFVAEKHQPPTSIKDLADRYSQVDRTLASFGQNLEIPEGLLPIFKEKFDFYYDSKSRSVKARLSADDRYLEAVGPLELTK